MAIVPVDAAKEGGCIGVVPAAPWSGDEEVFGRGGARGGAARIDEVSRARLEGVGAIPWMCQCVRMDREVVKGCGFDG